MATAEERAEAAERMARMFERHVRGYRRHAKEMLDQAACAKDNARAYWHFADAARCEGLDLSLDAITRPTPGDALALRGEVP